MQDPESDSKTLIDEIDEMLRKQGKAFKSQRSKLYHRNNLRFHQVLMNPDCYSYDQDWIFLLVPVVFLGYPIARNLAGSTTSWDYGVAIVAWLISLINIISEYRDSKFKEYIIYQPSDKILQNADR